MFIGEHKYGILTKLESLDVTFSERDFPRIGEIDRDLHLYKMMDPDIRSTLEQQLMLEPSGSELAPIAITVKESMLRKKIWQFIPRRWFKIERKVHIVTQYDDIELKSVL